MSTPTNPGPCRAVSTGNHQALIVADESGINIAVLYDKAHAPLFAAAPKLLEALGPLLFEVEQILISTKHFPECAVKMSRRAAVRQAREAIAEALNS